MNKNEVKIKAYAKVNLFLEILKRRSDGFHKLESLFARVDLADHIEIKKKKTSGIDLILIDRANIGFLPKEKNLAYKAALAFCLKFNIAPAFRIKVIKKIPAGAGLGGGSSDAAAVLSAMAKLCFGKNAGNKRKELFKIGESLGSDIPFFMSEFKMALCKGRGEKIIPVSVKAKLPHIMIVWPDAFVSTKAVYETLDLPKKNEIRKNRNKLKKFIENLKLPQKADFCPYLFNRLETPAFRISGKVGKMKNLLVKRGFPCVLMSGSGGSVFVVSYDLKELKKTKKILTPLHKFIFLAKFN